MKTPQSFTKLQLDEMHSRLSIVRDEPDLIDSYEATELEIAHALDILYNAKPKEKIFFIPEIADCLIGELENSIEICDHNAFFSADPHEKSVCRSDIRAYRDAIKKLSS
jgi:hypothetical protein